MDQTSLKLLIVDVQKKLFEKIDQKESLENQLITTIKSFQALEIPVWMTEQYPKGLGETLSSIKDVLLPNTPYFEKTTFACTDDDELLKAMTSLPKTHWVLVGIEAHIRVLLTALGLKRLGHNVTILKDAVGSRKNELKDHACFEMVHEGIQVTSLETFLFHLVKDSKHPKFKEISQLIKN